MMRMMVVVIGRVRRAVPQCSADPRLHPVKCMFNGNGFGFIVASFVHLH